MRIVLVRHGRSAHVEAAWLDRAGVHAWRAAYDAAGLAQDDRPPVQLREAVGRAGLVVASDLQRAVESAALLRADGAHALSPLLREVPLPVPGPAWLRLPLGGWGTLIGLWWMMAMAAHGGTAHGEVNGRAAQAAEWLASLAAQHDDIVVVTHGAFRRYLFNALVRAGWSATPGRRGYEHWSAWTLERLTR